MKSKGIIIVLIVAALILLIPLIAMQYTDEVDWSALDFVIAYILLAAVGLSVYFISKLIKKPKRKWLIIAVIILLFVLVWTELAVGIFGTPFAGD